MPEKLTPQLKIVALVKRHEGDTHEVPLFLRPNQDPENVVDDTTVPPPDQDRLPDNTPA